MGRFKGALNPKTDDFTAFAEFVDQHLSAQKDKKIAMYCTGGIRCERSTAYLKQKGFEHVYHLKGGILRYLEQMPQSESLWEGDCFVFDQRVAVDTNLLETEIEMCFKCRAPLSPDEQKSEYYVIGEHCPYCFQIRNDTL